MRTNPCWGCSCTSAGKFSPRWLIVRPVEILLIRPSRDDSLCRVCQPTQVRAANGQLLDCAAYVSVLVYLAALPFCLTMWVVESAPSPVLGDPLLRYFNPSTACDFREFALSRSQRTWTIRTHAVCELDLSEFLSTLPFAAVVECSPLSAVVLSVAVDVVIGPPAFVLRGVPPRPRPPPPFCPA